VEQRLELRGSRAVAHIVYEWLGRDSPDPWRRALDQGLTIGPPVAKIVPVWGSLLIFVGATVGAVYVAERLQAERLALGTAAVVTVLALLLAK